MEKNKYIIQNCVPYQRCPLCNGTGKGSIDSTAMSIVCTVCYGEKIIPMHIILEDIKVVGETEDLVSTSKACKLLGVCRTTLWRMENDGKISHLSVEGRKKYRVSDIRKIVSCAV